MFSERQFDISAIVKSVMIYVAFDIKFPLRSVRQLNRFPQT